MQNNKEENISNDSNRNTLDANVLAVTVPTFWQNKQLNSQISWPNICALRKRREEIENGIYIYIRL